VAITCYNCHTELVSPDDEACSHAVVGASSTVTFISLPVSIGTVLFAVVMGALGPLAVAALALAIILAAASLLLIGTALWTRGEILAG